MNSRPLVYFLLSGYTLSYSVSVYNDRNIHMTLLGQPVYTGDDISLLFYNAICTGGWNM